MSQRLEWEASRPSALFKEMKSSIYAIPMVFPSGRRKIVERVVRTDWDTFNVFFVDGSVLRNVELPNLEIPSEKVFDLLTGNGVIRCNKQLGDGSVDESFFSDYAERESAFAKLKGSRAVASELKKRFRYPEGSSVARKEEVKRAEHLRDVRRATRTGSRRSRSSGMRRVPSVAGRFLGGSEYDEEEFL